MSETPEQFLENQIVNQNKAELSLKDLGKQLSEEDLKG